MFLLAFRETAIQFQDGAIIIRVICDEGDSDVPELHQTRDEVDERPGVAYNMLKFFERGNACESCYGDRTPSLVWEGYNMLLCGSHFCSGLV